MLNCDQTAQLMVHSSKIYRRKIVRSFQVCMSADVARRQEVRVLGVNYSLMGEEESRTLWVGRSDPVVAFCESVVETRGLAEDEASSFRSTTTGNCSHHDRSKSDITSPNILVDDTLFIEADNTLLGSVKYSIGQDFQ
ncbi:hypothetical protein pipiens_011620 [Culex pipiens pipiens]|uniref:Uncharacterized protein n=1 Tax=Culex pipiens pipiens TaxID=38569 RepID=A0ABD1D5I9_CULPP